MHRRYCVFAASFMFVSVAMEVFAKPLDVNNAEEDEITEYFLGQHIDQTQGGIHLTNNSSTLLEQVGSTFPHSRSTDINMQDPVNKYLSKLTPVTRIGDAHRAVTEGTQTTPEYMLELYHRLSKSSSYHRSNIVRSFKNIHKQEPSSKNVQSSIGAGFRKHSLTFNISTISSQEKIAFAELRLFTLIQKDQRSFHGVSRFVTIFEIVDDDINSSSNRHRSQKFLTSKYIHNFENAWETFDVTAALKRSLKLSCKLEHFEIRIQSLMSSRPSDDMDINAKTDDVKQPLLVVYSDDTSPEHELNADRHELIMHEMETNVQASYKLTTEEGEDPGDMYTTNMADEILSRFKRSKPGRGRGRGYHRSSVCKRRPMYVDFDDIQWRNWIIAPPGYQAYQCAGRCYFPLSDHPTPSKHAIIQSLLQQRHPKRAARPCCAPTKLGPISILYIDNQGVVTYKYRYEGMVVTECGCQ